MTLITFGIYSIWFGLGMKKWVVKHTVFADDDSYTGSYFTGGAGGWFVNHVLIFFSLIFTLGILTPWAIVHHMKWEAKHTVINGAPLIFKGTGGQLFVKNLIFILLTPLTLGIYALFYPVRLLKWQYSKTFALDEVDEIPQKSGAGIAVGVIAVVLVLVLIAAVIGAFLLRMPVHFNTKNKTDSPLLNGGNSLAIADDGVLNSANNGEDGVSFGDYNDKVIIKNTSAPIPKLTEDKAKELVKMSNVAFLLYHFESVGMADETKSYELFTFNNYYVTCYAAKGIDTLSDLENYLLKYFSKEYAKNFMNEKQGHWFIENDVIYFEPNYAMGSNSMSTENIIIKDLGDNKYSITAETEWSGPRTIYVVYEDSDYKLDLINGKEYIEE